MPAAEAPILMTPGAVAGAPAHQRAALVGAVGEHAQRLDQFAWHLHPVPRAAGRANVLPSALDARTRHDALVDRALQVGADR